MPRTKKSLTNRDIQLLDELRKREELPHLFGWKWYDWAWKYFVSANKYNFLVAANQISKSTTQIRKAVHWATEPDLWKKLWPHSPKPTQFWYFYPAKSLMTAEFHEKWEPEILPRGKMKDDPKYGWQAEMRAKDIHAIHFNSGVSIYFKSYEMDAQNLQGSTIYAVFCDEELPWDLFPEIRARLTATNGYFHHCFTATLGQDEWRRTMEPATKEEELFPDALKLQVSMYDCLIYKDGSASHWTRERILQVEQECATEVEIQRRVHGRFVVSSGLKIPGFNRGLNNHKNEIMPGNWPVYTGVDIGTGGEKNHPAAIVMVAVRPDYKFGVVFKAWRGDGIVTAPNDILEKYQEMLVREVPSPNGTLTKTKIHPVIQSYDWQAKDFFIIATRANIAFTPADKKRDAGFSMLNTLFKMRMLAIMDDDPELSKLVNEITSLKEGERKTTAHDDLVDAIRYAVMHIPWNFDGVAKEIIGEVKEEEIFVDERTAEQIAWDERRIYRGAKTEEGSSEEDELSEWQSYLD